MIHIKKISIAFILYSITTICQAAEPYHDASLDAAQEKISVEKATLATKKSYLDVPEFIKAQTQIMLNNAEAIKQVEWENSNNPTDNPNYAVEKYQEAIKALNSPDNATPNKNDLIERYQQIIDIKNGKSPEQVLQERLAAYEIDFTNLMNSSMNTAELIAAQSITSTNSNNLLTPIENNTTLEIQELSTDTNQPDKTKESIETTTSKNEFVSTSNGSDIFTLKNQPTEITQGIMDIAYEKLQNQLDEDIENIIRQMLKLPHADNDSLTNLMNKVLKSLINRLFNLSTPSAAAKPINTFKNEIEYLAEHIEKYNSNTTGVYTSIEEMLDFIDYMNLFIKEVHITPLTMPMIENINISFLTANETSNIFKMQNIILDLSLVPQEIIAMFESSIDKSQNLITMKNSTSILAAIYNQDGSITQIINNWQDFMKSKYVNEENCRYYAAFTTFLLIFQNTIIATTSILNDTSLLFKVTNKIELQTISHLNPTN